MESVGTAGIRMDEAQKYYYEAARPPFSSVSGSTTASPSHSVSRLDRIMQAQEHLGALLTNALNDIHGMANRVVGPSIEEAGGKEAQPKRAGALGSIEDRMDALLNIADGINRALRRFETV